MSNLQIIKIGDDTITLSMDIETHWIEYRLKINTQGVPPLQVFSLSAEDQKQIWSPKIVIGNDMVSKSKEGEKFFLIRVKDNGNLATWLIAVKKFYLSTTVKCDMNFQTFPFDKHVCKIEVSFNLHLKMTNLACSLLSLSSIHFLQ